MRIERLELTNYRGFEHLVLEFPEQGPTVFVGGNGSGKSSILKALARTVGDWDRPVGFYIDEAIGLDDVRAGATDADVGVRYRAGSEDRTIRARWREGELLPPAQQSEDSGRKGPLGILHFERGTRRRRSYSEFIDWFRDTENAENELRLDQDPSLRNPQLEAVRGAWSRFLGTLDKQIRFERMRFRRVLPNAPLEGLFVVEKDGVSLTLDQLSDGEAALLLLVGDFAMELVKGGHGPTCSNSVLLIDELDLHLHPSWQRRLLPALQAAFPNTQIIGTTHSPLIVGHLPPENVVLLRDFQATHPTASLGRDARDILLELMGTPTRSDEARALIGAVEAALDDEDLDVAKAKLAALEAMTGSDDPDALRLRAELFISEP